MEVARAARGSFSCVLAQAGLAPASASFSWTTPRSPWAVVDLIHLGVRREVGPPCWLTHRTCKHDFTVRAAYSAALRVRFGHALDLQA